MKVVNIIDNDNYVIDQGSFDGTCIDDIYVIYLDGDEIKDPDTGESLGRLELPKARCKVTHVQEHISIIRSLDAKPKDRTLTFSEIFSRSIYGDTSPYNFLSQEEREISIGDKIRKEKK